MLGKAWVGCLLIWVELELAINPLKLQSWAWSRFPVIIELFFFFDILVWTPYFSHAFLLDRETHFFIWKFDFWKVFGVVTYFCFIYKRKKNKIRKKNLKCHSWRKNRSMKNRVWVWGLKWTSTAVHEHRHQKIPREQNRAVWSQHSKW